MKVNEQMQAAVLYGKEELRVEQVAVPEIGPHDLLVKVRTALTCGTDLKVFRRGHHARMIKPPALFGHELAGDIVAVGDEVTKFRPGQRVVAANSAPCGDCFFCRRGREKPLRGSTLQQRRLRPIHADSRAHRRKERPRDSGGHRLPRRGHGRTSGLRPARRRGLRHSSGRYGRRDRSGADRFDVRAPGQAGRRPRDRGRPEAATARPRRAHGRLGADHLASPAKSRSRRCGTQPKADAAPMSSSRPSGRRTPGEGLSEWFDRAES